MAWINNFSSRLFSLSRLASTRRFRVRFESFSSPLHFASLSEHYDFLLFLLFRIHFWIFMDVNNNNNKSNKRKRRWRMFKWSERTRERSTLNGRFRIFCSCSSPEQEETIQHKNARSQKRSLSFSSTEKSHKALVPSSFVLPLSFAISFSSSVESKRKRVWAKVAVVVASAAVATITIIVRRERESQETRGTYGFDMHWRLILNLPGPPM